MSQSIARLLIILLELLIWVIPISILVVGWHWLAEMLREVRAIRKQLDAIAAGIEINASGKEQPR